MRWSGGRGRTRLGEKTPLKRSVRTWECTQVIFLHRDQKAFTFRCFPDMNIQHPYWNLIWVSLSQGSFHQCLLPEATADWQPNFSKEQTGKKGEIWWCWRGEWCEVGADEWRDAVGGGGVHQGRVPYHLACTNRMLQIARNYELTKKAWLSVLVCLYCT